MPQFNFTAKGIYAAGALALLTAAIFSAGYHHFDEHFQVLEFAGLKLGLAKESDMPWEYFYKMRSAIQPAMVVVFYKIFALAGRVNPFALATFTRILSAVLSFCTVLLALKIFLPQITKVKIKQSVIWLAFLLWFAVYNEVRFSSENWAGNLFLIGLCIALGERKSGFSYFAAGALFALAFLFRFQTGFLLAGFGVWQLVIARQKLKLIAQMLIGFSTLMALGLLIDHWFYGCWTFTPWNYFEQNILLHKAAGFGIEPWWYYFTEIIVRAVPPFSVFIIAALLLFFWYYPRHIFTFILVPFLLGHILVSHKEIRFLFPIIIFVPIAIGITCQKLMQTGIWPDFNKRWLKGLLLIFWISNTALLLVVMFKPAEGLITLYKQIYSACPNGGTVYYTHNNPYYTVGNVNFYKPPNLNLKQVESTGQIDRQGNLPILFATREKDILKNDTRWQLIYSGLPTWLEPYNYNHWQERTRFFYLYKLK